LHFSIKGRVMAAAVPGREEATDTQRAIGAIPRFALYGEAPHPGQELLHIEEVQSRSRLYQWEIDAHVHQGLYQIVWLASGMADVMLDEWRAQVEGPAAIVVPPGVVHGFRFAPDTDGRVLTLSARLLVEGEFEDIGNAFRQLFLAPGVLHFSPDDGEASRLHVQLAELSAEFALPGAADAPVLRWLARAVVWRLARASEQGQREGGQARAHQALFTRFLLLVEQHFLAHWPMERYASRLGLSTQRLNRLVRAERGCTALELVHERLTREACRRLVYVAAPAASLALELGFEDPAYFSRFFKRRTGRSPQQWRREHTRQAGAS
jgi:AraC family transcriptional regulator, transcriptional activator of pobA